MKTKSLWKEFTYIKTVLEVQISRTSLSDYLNFAVQVQIDSFIVKFLVMFLKELSAIEINTLIIKLQFL